MINISDKLMLNCLLLFSLIIILPSDCFTGSSWLCIGSAHWCEIFRKEWQGKIRLFVGKNLQNSLKNHVFFCILKISVYDHNFNWLVPSIFIYQLSFLSAAFFFLSPSLFLSLYVLLSLTLSLSLPVYFFCLCLRLILYAFTI